MPDRNALRVGDRIRILAVPECDLRQRQREIAVGTADPDSTASVIERIINTDPCVTIQCVDEYGAAWFEVEFEGPDGLHYHSIMILDDESWERVGE